jgi:hypothetical protein
MPVFTFTIAYFTCKFIIVFVILLVQNFYSDVKEMHLYLRVYKQADVVQIFDKEEYLLWVVGVVVFLNVKLVPFVHGQEVI